MAIIFDTPRMKDFLVSSKILNSRSTADYRISEYGYTEFGNKGNYRIGRDRKFAYVYHLEKARWTNRRV